MNQIMTLPTRHKIQALAVWGRARYLSVTEVPHWIFMSGQERKPQSPTWQSFSVSTTSVPLPYFTANHQRNIVLNWKLLFLTAYRRICLNPPWRSWLRLSCARMFQMGHKHTVPNYKVFSLKSEENRFSSENMQKWKWAGVLFDGYLTVIQRAALLCSAKPKCSICSLVKWADTVFWLCTAVLGISSANSLSYHLSDVLAALHPLYFDTVEEDITVLDPAHKLSGYLSWNYHLPSLLWTWVKSLSHKSRINVTNMKLDGRKQMHTSHLFREKIKCGCEVRA